MESQIIRLRKAIVFVLVLTVSAMGTFTISTDQVEAKSTPKLTKKSVMIAKGGSQTIKLENGNGKWTIKDNGVAKIKKKTKKSVTIVPVKAGKTVVTCKVKGKKLKCNVRVLNNKVGKATDNRIPTILVGKTFKDSFSLTEGVSLKDISSSNTKCAKITKSTSLDAESGVTTVTFKVKGLKPGRIMMTFTYLEDGKLEYEKVPVIIINGFRGKAKVKKTDKNYKKWRKETITNIVSSDMTTWEMIDAVGYLISSGKYGIKGGATGKQLWYGGNGTCVSGAKMMNDFMKDIGVSSKIHFMGNKAGATDIYGFYIMYMTQHKNTWIKLGGKRYELNAQPGSMWPIGIVAR